MKEAINDIKSDIKAKLLYWNNIQSKKAKVGLIFLFVGLIALKIFTTVLTFDWLTGLFS
jgi:hypothetical protein